MIWLSNSGRGTYEQAICDQGFARVIGHTIDGESGYLPKMIVVYIHPFNNIEVVYMPPPSLLSNPSTSLSFQSKIATIEFEGPTPFILTLISKTSG